MLTVADELGFRQVFRANGPAGVAALGFGTERIPKVVKVVGPGSWPVTCAQVEMQRWGTATMMALGPTESVVIADDSADPVRLAADLLIEAEHGTDSCTAADHHVGRSSPRRSTPNSTGRPPNSRRPEPRRPRRRSGSTVAASSSTTSTRRPRSPTPSPPSTSRWRSTPTAEDELIGRLVHAGEILVGQHTPFSAANFLIGCPASLPTNGFARVSSGITVEAFLKRTAIARADESRAAPALAPSVIALADVEGFPAHAAALRRRFPLG